MISIKLDFTQYAQQALLTGRVAILNAIKFSIFYFQLYKCHYMIFINVQVLYVFSRGLHSFVYFYFFLFLMRPNARKGVTRNLYALTDPYILLTGQNFV